MGSCLYCGFNRCECTAETFTEEDVSRASSEGYEAGWAAAMARAAEVCGAEGRHQARTTGPAGCEWAAKTIRALTDRSDPS